MSRFVSHMLASALIALPFAVPAQATIQSNPAQRAEKREERREQAGRAEKHPEIRAAIRSLERAKYDLQHAAHDFGGHRADALRATDEAIRQLKLALQYDTK